MICLLLSITAKYTIGSTAEITETRLTIPSSPMSPSATGTPSTRNSSTTMPTTRPTTRPLCSSGSGLEGCWLTELMLFLPSTY